MKNLTWAYATDWYDGPISGKVLNEEGQIYWALMIDGQSPTGDAEDRVRTYALYEMPEDWWQLENERHQLWLACCGNYCWDKPEGWTKIQPINDYYETYPPDGHYTVTGIGKFVIAVTEHQITIPIM